MLFPTLSHYTFRYINQYASQILIKNPQKWL